MSRAPAPNVDDVPIELPVTFWLRPRGLACIAIGALALTGVVLTLLR